MSSLLYNRIGDGYNQTRKADPYISKRIMHFLSAEPGNKYLDMGCGTGNYTAALAETGIEFWGVEPSPKMLKEASRQHKNIKWVLGSAENIPLSDDFFDGCLATLTIHHWPNLKKGFVEISRVLKTSSRFVIFTSTPDQMKGYWLNHYFPEMMAESIRKMPSRNEIRLAAAGASYAPAGEESYHAQADLQDLFLYSGKHRPELYLDENIRKGISSFASFLNSAERDRGLKRLRKDVQSGEIKAITGEFENPLGDYLFMCVESNKR